MITLTKDTLWIAEMFMANWSHKLNDNIISDHIKQLSLYLIAKNIESQKSFEKQFYKKYVFDWKWDSCIEINLFLVSIFYFLKSYSLHNSYQKWFTEFSSKNNQQSSKQDEHVQYRNILKILKGLKTKFLKYFSWLLKSYFISRLIYLTANE